MPESLTEPVTAVPDFLLILRPRPSVPGGPSPDQRLRRALKVLDRFYAFDCEHVDYLPPDALAPVVAAARAAGLRAPTPLN